MEYLAIQASSSAAQNPEAPSFVLLPLKNRMLSVFDRLQEMAEEAKETDSSIVAVERWLPVTPYWTGYEKPVVEAFTEAEETDNWIWPTLWLTDEKIESMETKSIDAQTIHMYPNRSGNSPTEAVLKGRQGDIRVTSHPFTEGDLEATPKAHV